MTITRGLAVGVVLAGAAVGLAAPASAEPLNGTYTETVTDNGGSMVRTGATIDWILTPCGPDCTHIQQTAADNPWDTDVHLQGNTWSGTIKPGRTIAFDKDTLAGTEVMALPGPPPVTYTLKIQLTKNG